MENPEYYQSEYCTRAGLLPPQFTPEKRVPGEVKTEQFLVEEFFDFSNDDDNNVILTDSREEVFDAGVNGNSTESSSVTAVGDGVYQIVTDGNDFSEDLCLPYDDLAEFEWLSNLEEESFSSEDLQKLQLISGIKARPDGMPFQTPQYQPESNQSSTIFQPQIPVPGKARSKRSRAAPGKWISRIQVLTQTSSSLEFDGMQMFARTGKKTVKVASRNKDDNVPWSTGGRKCLHCATDKTPQWRTGPMGPKTLCNACGVRYKSGRLVPEYRPAASPTFMLAKHSNSHRKVLELRRQKEMVDSHQQHHGHNQQLQYLHHHPSMMFDVPNVDEHSRHDFCVPHF